MSTPPFLEKAQEGLAAARALMEVGCYNSAANRAYYAVFNAARAAMIAAGTSTAEQTWSHMAIHGQFQKLTRQRKTYPAHMVADILDLRLAREMADYGPDLVPSKSATRLVKVASRFVQAVEVEILL